jgi:hypothetical protein
MEPNLAGSIYVRSSIKLLHLVPFGLQTWPPRAILVSDWLLFKKVFSSETAWQNGAKLGRKHLCKILYKAPGTIYARFGPYIDASCQVWLHLAKLFQRRRFF